MKKSILILFVLFITCACSNDGPSMNGCYEFHHRIRYRSVDSEWSIYNDTICNITEEYAEEYRAKNDISDSKWIRFCSKKRITCPRIHTKSI